MSKKINWTRIVRQRSKDNDSYEFEVYKELGLDPSTIDREVYQRLIKSFKLFLTQSTGMIDIPASAVASLISNYSRSSWRSMILSEYYVPVSGIYLNQSLDE